MHKKENTLNKLKKTLVVTGGILAVGASSLVGAGAVSAQTSSNNTHGPTALIQKIAQKFGLNEAEVKAVFDEEHEAREAERRQNLEDRLSQAVTDGKITEAQKTAVLSKVDELDTYRDSLSDKTDEERREAMKTKMAELKTWAEENDIPMDYLRMGGPRGGHGGGMGEMAPPADRE
jgi:DNA-binding transcriptional MerR regulator